MSDLISRQDAINLLKKWSDGYDYIEIETELAIKEFQHLPSTQPKRGRWKQTKAYPNLIFCDECGEPYERSNSNDKWNYCPNCGAKMEEQE